MACLLPVFPGTGPIFFCVHDHPSAVFSDPSGAFGERSLLGSDFPIECILDATSSPVMSFIKERISGADIVIFMGGAMAHMRAVLKPQSSVLIIAEQGEVKVVKSCARARSAQVRPKGRARLQF